MNVQYFIFFLNFVLDCARDQYNYMKTGLIGLLFFCYPNGNYKNHQHGNFFFLTKQYFFELILMHISMRERRLYGLQVCVFVHVFLRVCGRGSYTFIMLISIPLYRVVSQPWSVYFHSTGYRTLCS